MEEESGARRKGVRNLQSRCIVIVSTMVEVGGALTQGVPKEHGRLHRIALATAEVNGVVWCIVRNQIKAMVFASLTVAEENGAGRGRPSS